MPSVLAWIDHDSKARERTLRILSLFQEKESRDELGLGSVRDSFADQFFPGTSTIQTRLRYMLFVPWIYHSLEEKERGLDFHTWCHAVVHWNLPSNPVDLEQREGRVHRYKGHSVRKNIAERYGLTALSVAHEGGDPWQTLFQIAAQQKSNGHSDLIPYWIFEDGSARVERRIPLLPYSKEVGKLKRLKQGLALYRMVFGQPRQEDLLFSLSQNGNHESVDVTDWLISLQPPGNGFE